jgi:hypothetical protein
MRSAKNIWITGEDINDERRKITVHDDVETIMPLGRYSMAPILRASKEAKS